MKAERMSIADYSEAISYQAMHLGEVIRDNTTNGKCSNCGECCSNILPLSKKEIETIRRYVKKNRIKEQITAFPFARRDECIDWTCPFRDRKERKCTIYEVRPQICKEWNCHSVRNGVKCNAAHFPDPIKIVDMREVFFNHKQKDPNIFFPPRRTCGNGKV